MILQPEFGESGEELASPKTVVVLLVIQRDEDVVTDAESLQLRGGESLSCHGDAEVLDVGAVIGVRGGGGATVRARGGGGRGSGGGSCGDWI